MYFTIIQCQGKMYVVSTTLNKKDDPFIHGFNIHVEK